jgi:hypothetical protein
MATCSRNWALSKSRNRPNRRPVTASRLVISSTTMRSGYRVNVPILRRAANLLIYLSVALGLVLLPQIYYLVPSWLFYSVFAGWVTYLLVAIAAARSREMAYPLAFVLSILTLAVSLPQPEHYSFVSEGMWLATLTFTFGSVLQIALLILIPIYLVKKRKATV